MTQEDTSPFVVSFDWLEERLGQTPDLKVVDASWYLPLHNRDPRAEYKAARIPGAVFFDQDAIVDPESPLPHTLPSPDLFAAAAGRLGISETDTIVVYDGPGMMTAPRVWWMFRIYGAKNVYVLDGGFDSWGTSGRAVESGPVSLPEPKTFRASFNADAVASLDAMREIVATGARQIADARSPGRFTGSDPEPRAGLRSGHMPGARNVPVLSLSENGKLKSLSSLRGVFEAAGIDLERPVVTSCGSGVTAAVITLALSSLGHGDHKLYDGSWSEWGGLDDTPVVAGDA